MNSKLWSHRALALTAAILAGSSLLSAADTDEIANLKAALAAQQQQIQMLQDSINKLTAVQSGQAPAQPTNLGTVASLSPVFPSPAPAASALPAFPSPKPQAAAGGNGNPCEAPPDATTIPPYLRLGSICITPVGFMDLTRVARQERRFGHRQQLRQRPLQQRRRRPTLANSAFSPQNSRLGFRIDGNWKGAHFIGYNEFDFLGTSGTNAWASPTAPSCRASACSGWTSARASWSFWPARAGAC